MLYAKLALGIAAIALPAGLVVTVGGCTGTTAAAGANKKTNGQNAGDAPAVEVVSVMRQDLSRTIEQPGTVEGYETADLYAKIGGYLDKMNVDIGDPIKKGQVLATLFVPEMKQELQQKRALVDQAKSLVDQASAAMDQAHAEVASAHASVQEAQTERAEKEALFQFHQRKYDRYKSLADERAVQQALLDEARLELDAAIAAKNSVEARIRTAEAKFNSAEAKQKRVAADYASAEAGVAVSEANDLHVQTMLQYADIRAPFNGYVTQRHLDAGAFIQPAEGNSGAKPLLTVTRTDVVRITLDIPMNEVRFLDRGDPAVLNRINVLPGEKFEEGVVVARFSPSLNKDSRMMRVEIDIDNPDGKLLPGYYGYVTLKLADLPDTPVIPSSAVMTKGDETYVYQVEGGTCRKCIITPNYQDGSIMGIASGLKGGEQIIAAGGGQLDEGQRVTAAVRDAARG